MEARASISVVELAGHVSGCEPSDKSGLGSVEIEWDDDYSPMVFSWNRRRIAWITRVGTLFAVPRGVEKPRGSAAGFSSICSKDRQIGTGPAQSRSNLLRRHGSAPGCAARECGWKIDHC